jgi:uncharacterized repeat protein (TIGR03803 family)
MSRTPLFDRSYALACFFTASLAALPAMAGGHPPRPLDMLYIFNSQVDGYAPYLATADKAGNIYGYSGGGRSTNCANGCGTIFRLSPDGAKTVLHTFNGGPADGSGVSGILLKNSGEIYGTTVGGGKDGYGTIFKLAPDGTETLLHSFAAPVHHYSIAPKGIWPLSGVIAGGDGNFYGTAWHGGINNHCGEGGCGLVFRITPGGKYDVVYVFQGTDDGCAPVAGLAQDRAGNLYGTANGCGAFGSGTVYKIDPAGTETVLHAFSGGADGNSPQAAPILDDAGNLYGGTTFGGTGCNGDNGCGIIYKVAPDGTETILYSFRDLVDGLSVAGKLFRDKSGTLFGATQMGGATFSCNRPLGCGTVFELSPDGRKTTLHSFLGPTFGDGSGPTSILLPGHGRDGHYLYGAAGSGPQCCGMIYKYPR